MKINKECRLFHRDVYSYDITSCHYAILKKSGFDVSNINFENKEERNITIGKMMGQNPRISSLLRTTTESIIDVYLHNNQIMNEDVLIRQYDGIITTKPLQQTDTFLDLKLQSIFNILIISSDRKKYLATDYKNYLIKGVSNRYTEIDEVYKQLLNINFSNKISIFETLKKIKYEILTGYNHKLYCIPTNKNSFNIFIKEYGQVEISKTLSNIYNLDDLDREWYFENYLRSFTEAIVIEFA